MNIAERTLLVEKLICVAAVADRHQRDIIVSQLDPSLRGRIPRSDVLRPDVVSIVSACGEYDGGLDDLMAAVDLVEGGSDRDRALQAFRQAVVEVKAATAKPADIRPPAPPTAAAQPVAPGGQAPAAADPAAGVPVTFAGFISDLCTQNGWKLSEVDDELAMLEFDVGADGCQTVLLIPDELGLIILAPSGPTFDNEDDIPDELSFSLLVRNAKSRYTHWMIIETEDQYLYACASNLDRSNIDALSLKTGVELVVQESGAGLADSIDDAAGPQLCLDWAQFHFN